MKTLSQTTPLEFLNAAVSYKVKSGMKARTLDSHSGGNFRLCLWKHQGVAELGTLHAHWLRLSLCKKQRIQACTDSEVEEPVPHLLIWLTERGNSKDPALGPGFASSSTQHFLEAHCFPGVPSHIQLWARVWQMDQWKLCV